MRKPYIYPSVILGLTIPTTKPIVMTTPYEQEQDRKVIAGLAAHCVTKEQADLMLDSLLALMKAKEPSSSIVCDSMPKQT